MGPAFCLGSQALFAPGTQQERYFGLRVCSVAKHSTVWPGTWVRVPTETGATR